jgi:predicted dehydrogenase
MSNIGIGIIGCGGIAFWSHLQPLKICSDTKVTAICDIDENRLDYIGEEFEIDKEYRFTDYQDLISCSKVDAVEICTPNYLHAKMAIDVINAGKAVNVEKPIALNYEQAQEIENAFRSKNIPSMICFSYRFKPAVRFAKWILSQGLIGDVLSVNVEYLKSSAFMEGRRLDWRFVKKLAGTGVLGDLGSHLIDMSRFLVGDLKSVCARTGIIVKKRKYLDSEEYGPVETDDYCNFIADFECGATGTFSITRCAIGNENTIRFEIYATKGVLSFDLNNPEVLGVCIGEVDIKSFGMHTVKVPHEYYADQEQTFVNLVNGKSHEYTPTINDGVRCQKILDALLESSEQNKWVSLK